MNIRTPEAPSPKHGRPAETNVPFWILVTGLVVLYAALEFQVWGDGHVRFRALVGVIEGSPIPSPNRYSLVGPLISTPLYLLGHLFQTPQWWCARFNFVLFLVGAMTLFRGLRPHADSSIRMRFLLCLTFCSMFPAHLEHYYGEVFSALALAVGTLWIEDTRRASWGWLLVVLAVVNTPGMGIGLGLLALVRIARSGRFRVLLVVPMVLGLIALDNRYRTGTWLGAYVGDQFSKTLLPYSGLPAFSYPLGFGVFNILFSSGKGLAWFLPGLWLTWAFYRDTRLGASPEAKRTMTLWLSVVAGMVLLYAKWHAWHGDWFWGPRFFLLACIPASLVLAQTLSAPHAPTPVRMLALTALTLAHWGAVTGLVFGQTASGICQRNDGEFSHLCLNVPEFSALWRPFVVWTDVTPAKGLFWTYATFVYGYLALPQVRALRSALQRMRHEAS